MSAATRTTPAAPDMRRAGAALGALTLAVAVVAAVAFSQASSTRSQVTPVAGSLPAAHDHGWSTAAANGPELIIRGSNGGGLNYTGIPYPAPGSGPELIIRGSNGGGLNYTGIPYPAPGSGRAGVVNGARLAQ